MPVANTTVYVDNHRHGAQSVTTLEGAPFELSVLMLNADALVHIWSDPQMAPHRDRRVGVWYWEVGMLPERCARPTGWSTRSGARASTCGRPSEASSDRPVLKHPLAIEPPGADLADRATSGCPRTASSSASSSTTRACSPQEPARPRQGIPRRRSVPTTAPRWSSRRSTPGPSGPRPARCARPPGPDRHPHRRRPLRARSRCGLLPIARLLRLAAPQRRLGLTIASAMAAGTPAIATGWSGNLEFMTPRTRVLVPYRPASTSAPTQSRTRRRDPGPNPTRMRCRGDAAALRAPGPRAATRRRAVVATSMTPSAADVPAPMVHGSVQDASPDRRPR